MVPVLYGRDSSYNVQKVLWSLDELGVEYQHIPAGGKYGGLNNPEFRVLNPMQKVPVLVYGDTVVTESNTIVRFLGRTFSDSGWCGQGPASSAAVESWMDWSVASFEPAFIGIFWGYYRTPEAQRDMGEINTQVGIFENLLRVLSIGLGKNLYLYKDELTAADIVTGVFLYRVVQIDLPVRIPVKVMEWYHRLCNRKAYQNQVMRDFSELKGRLEY